jgi:RNA methyltransferase, TrmH family
MKQISSIQNPFIKNVLQLQDKAKVRKQSGTFIIEGQREIELAIKGGYEIETLLVDTEIVSKLLNLNLFQAKEIIEISSTVYQKIAYRDSTEGIIAIAKSKLLTLSNLILSNNPLILVAEGLEKPGNLGALLRTADAANIDAVIIANPKSDMYNPNIIRSSVGCLFTRQIAVASTEEVVNYLKEKNINIYCATLQDSTEYHVQNYNQPTALVVGTEATGITEFFRQNATKNINIPMQGVIDSMNVSVAAAILLFEAKRQRGFI